VFETFLNLLKIPELKKKLIFTILMVFVYRIGAHIPTPGVDPKVLADFFSQSQNTLFGMFDMFVGGAFQKATIFALGIMPYISASIIIQLFGSVFPYFHKLQQDPEGRKKITQLTRYGTVILALIQGAGISIFIQSITSPVTGAPAVVPIMQGFKFTLVTIISLVTGTIFIMWLGEKITIKGIGNGMSFIIFIGIVESFPTAIISEAQQVIGGTRHIFVELIILAIIFAMTAFVVLMYQAQRRIPIQTPKKVVGAKMYAGQNTVLPLRLIAAGVIPLIFASSLMMMPTTIAGFFKNSAVLDAINNFFNPRNVVYEILYGLSIIFFTYFYTAVIFNPIDIANNLKRSGGFIPGIRPGKKTAEFLEQVLSRITLPGSIFLAFIAIVPFLLMNTMNVQFYFGGTSVLIVIGVALDTLTQLESQLHMRNYNGFMKRGTLRGRR